MKGGLGQSLERGLEQLRAREILPSLDEQDPFETLRPHIPELERMPGGEVERESHVMLDGREIADKHGDRTRPDEQCVQKRPQVVDRTGIIDELLREPPCLIAKSLQPENARVVAIEHDSVVVPIEAEVRRASRYEVRAKQWLEMSSRAGLVSQNVQGKT